MMIQDKVKEGFDSVRSSMGRDEILAALGLARRRTALEVFLPAAGVFFAGLLVGTSVALLATPKTGREMRRNLRHKASELRGRANELGHRLGTSAENAADSMRHAVEATEDRMENGRRWAHK